MRGSGNRFGAVNLLVIVDDQVPEVQRVDVFGQQVQHEPVTGIQLVQQVLQCRPTDQPASGLSGQDPDPGHSDG